MSILKTPLTLPNGTVLKNRMAKSAMSENLSDSKHQTTPTLINAYKKWAQGGSGLLFTGNIMIDKTALGEPRNVVVENGFSEKGLKEWGQLCQAHDVHIWPQLNHPGRQAMEQINKELLAPSAVPLIYPGRKSASKKIPRALKNDEILKIIDAYGNAALILKNNGFTGVQIHGAHGYLVSQFLSPNTNIREDDWGGDIHQRSKFVVEVYRNIRKKVGADFPIGIKLNSTDFQKGGFTEEESMEVVKILSAEGMDLIEISGGTYEAPAMMGYKKKSTREREAYFLDYIQKARKITSTPLMLTGGFRHKENMERAIESGDVDLIGVARPYCIFPNMVNDMFNNTSDYFPTKVNKTGVKAIDAGLSIFWYEAQIKLIGENKKPQPNLSGWKVFMNYLSIIMKKKLS